MINAIWRLFILQADAKKTSFSSEPDEAFEELNNNLNDGTPIVLNLSSGDIAHAVNAIRLIQDNEDSNKFKIEIYDNNYTGETKYINVTRNKYNKFALDVTAWINDYNYTLNYDLNNDGIPEEINASLSYPTIE